MDAYLASGELREASHFYLNLNFEVLNGCKLKCPGCYVEKKGQDSFTDVQAKLLSNLLNQLKESLYVPFIAFVGPTDFLSAENFQDFFGANPTKEVLKSFTRLSVQTTYLDMKNAAGVARTLREDYGDMELEINIVIDPARIMDDAYLLTIEKNKSTFLSLLGSRSVRTFGIMNVYDYDKTKIAHLLRDYDFVHKRISHLFETTIDYNFSFGRNPNISNEEFVELCSRIRRLFDTAIASPDLSNEKSQYLRFSFGKLTDSLIERQYNYRNGKLFYSPLLYERFVSFRSDLEIPLEDFSRGEIEAYEQDLIIKQYEFAPQTAECENCPFLSSCVDRGILHLMKTYGTTDCLVAKKALITVNSMKDF